MIREITTDSDRKYYNEKLKETADIQERVDEICMGSRPFNELSDKAFMIAYWHYYHGFDFGISRPDEFFDQLDDPGTIVRCRRKFWKQYPQYRPGGTAAYKRSLKQQAIMQHMREENL